MPARSAGGAADSAPTVVLARSERRHRPDARHAQPSADRHSSDRPHAPYRKTARGGRACTGRTETARSHGRAPGRRRCIDIADRLAAIASTARSARVARRRVAEVAQDRRAQAAAGLGIRNHRRSMDDSLDVGADRSPCLRHHSKHVAPLEHGTDHIFLTWAERRVPEAPPKRIGLIYITLASSRTTHIAPAACQASSVRLRTTRTPRQRTRAAAISACL